MKVLMLGWEFPPFISGGLGTACYGLTRGMDELGTDVMFLLPKPVQSEFTTHVQLMSPGSQLDGGSESYQLSEFSHVTFYTIPAGARVSSYQSPAQEPEPASQSFSEAQIKEVREALARAGVSSPDPANEPTSILGGAGAGADYGGDMFAEVDRYTRLATNLAVRTKFDVIHAHDWMTYRAGIAVSALTGKPLIVHVHSTEFDRSGENVNQAIYDVERAGMHFASQVIAVSFLTKSIITARYGVPADKVNVVYNAIDYNGDSPQTALPQIGRDDKLVLFLGRITMQKGPEYFLGAAKKVLEVMDNVRFIMAGSGDMIQRTIRMAAEMGIGHRVLFTGFLRGADVERVFRMADLYVMPSVSEPFGIAPLEAMSNNVPVLISKQSGVSEVLTHALKVDFWDINEMANKIVAVLRHAPLRDALKTHGSIEVRKLSWKDSAAKCVEVYQKAIGA